LASIGASIVVMSGCCSVTCLMPSSGYIDIDYFATVACQTSESRRNLLKSVIRIWRTHELLIREGDMYCRLSIEALYEICKNMHALLRLQFLIRIKSNNMTVVLKFSLVFGLIPRSSGPLWSDSVIFIFGRP
jgi:hypothetical protein